MALTEWVRFAELGNRYPLLTLGGVGVTPGQPGDVYPYYTTTGIPVTFAAVGDPYPFVTVPQSCAGIRQEVILQGMQGFQRRIRVGRD